MEITIMDYEKILNTDYGQFKESDDPAQTTFERLVAIENMLHAMCDENTKQLIHNNGAVPTQNQFIMALRNGELK